MTLAFLAGMLVACVPDQTRQSDRSSTDGMEPAGPGTLQWQAAAVSQPGLFAPFAPDSRIEHEARNLLEQIQASYANGGGLTQEQLDQLQAHYPAGQPVNTDAPQPRPTPFTSPASPAAPIAARVDTTSVCIHKSAFFIVPTPPVCQYARNDADTLKRAIDTPADLQSGFE